MKYLIAAYLVILSSCNPTEPKPKWVETDSSLSCRRLFKTCQKLYRANYRFYNRSSKTSNRLIPPTHNKGLRENIFAIYNPSYGPIHPNKQACKTKQERLVLDQHDCSQDLILQVDKKKRESPDILSLHLKTKDNKLSFHSRAICPYFHLHSLFI